VPARITGDLIVHFHGDSATGCAARGLCGYSGTIIWTTDQPAALGVMGTTTRTGTSYSVYLNFEDNSLVGNGGGTTDADTTDPGGASCADAAYTGSYLPFMPRGRDLRLQLADASPSVLQTRCAGPLAGDLESALPSVTVPLSTLTRGQTQLPLKRDRSFAANGFAGTVSSTLSIALGRPGRRRIQRQRAELQRILTVEYRAKLAGAFTAAVSGDADEGLCGPLGACGASGTESVAPQSVGQVEFTAMAGARYPYAQLQRALLAGPSSRRSDLRGPVLARRGYGQDRSAHRGRNLHGPHRPEWRPSVREHRPARDLSGILGGRVHGGISNSLPGPVRSRGCLREWARTRLDPWAPNGDHPADREYRLH
jgi:hypothetical protein